MSICQIDKEVQASLDGSGSAGNSAEVQKSLAHDQLEWLQYRDEAGKITEHLSGIWI